MTAVGKEYGSSLDLSLVDDDGGAMGKSPVRSSVKAERARSAKPKARSI